MYYHAHITLQHSITAPKGWKETRIILDGSKTQEDFMMTKHYVIGHKGIRSVDDVMADIDLAFSNIDVARIKIEQTSDFTLPITSENYVEVHLKCIGETSLSAAWVRSRNPSEIIDGSPAFFYNRRIYAGKSHESVFDQIESELKGVAFIEKKIEQVVYDSNTSHDAWWA